MLVSDVSTVVDKTFSLRERNFSVMPDTKGGKQYAEQSS